MAIEQNEYKNLTPFKAWLMNQINTWGVNNFPFLEEDFDKLTNYGMMMKLMKALNDVITNENLVEDDMSKLYGAFTELQTYINNYFENLDVQEEINTKLDELVINGTLSNIINDELFSNINNRILQNSIDIGSINEEFNNTVKKTDSNIVGMSMLTQEVRSALTGGSTAVVGIDSVNTENISDKAITIYKLDDLLQENFTKEFENEDLGNVVDGNWKNVVDNEITNETNSAYQYYSVDLENNKIYNFSGYNMYNVPAIIIYDSTDNDRILTYTNVTDATIGFDPKTLIFKTNKEGIKAYINKHIINQYGPAKNNLLVTLSKIKEITQNKKENYIEKIKELQNYIAQYSISLSNYNIVANNDVPCRTEVYKLSKGTKYKVNTANIYTNCGLIILNEKLEPSYYSNTENVGNRPVAHTYEFTASDNGYALLQFINSQYYTVTSSIYLNEESNKYKTMKWTTIGDSLTDPTVNTNVKKYYSYIQDDLGINVQNLGQSGCGYKRKSANDKNTFVEQSLLIDNDTDVVTIFGSFNDHNIYDTDGLGTINDTTTDTVFGCVYTTFNNIVTNRPNAKIGVILPTPWNYNHMNPYDPTDINLQYIEGIRTIAKKFSIPVLDLFYGSSMFPWNDNFKTMFYVNGDGTHPNSQGNKRFAYQIEEFIKSLI